MIELNETTTRPADTAKYPHVELPEFETLPYSPADPEKRLTVRVVQHKQREHFHWVWIWLIGFFTGFAVQFLIAAL